MFWLSPQSGIFCCDSDLIEDGLTDKDSAGPILLFVSALFFSLVFPLSLLPR